MSAALKLKVHAADSSINDDSYSNIDTSFRSMHTIGKTCVSDMLLDISGKDDEETPDVSEFLLPAEGSAFVGGDEDDDDVSLDALAQELINFQLEKRRAPVPKTALSRSNSSNSPAIQALRSPRRVGGRKKAPPQRTRSMPMTIANAALANRFKSATRNSYYQAPPSMRRSNSTAGTSTSTGDADTSSQPQQRSPEDILQETILQDLPKDLLESNSWQEYLQAVTPQRLEAYSVEVARAIRRGDLAVLRYHHKKGATLDSCNSNGESTIHLACRLGRLEMVRFLVQEAKVSVRVQDNSGRSPLHDAVWTKEPNFALIELLVGEAPELLWMKDKRDYTALRYAPKMTWNAWESFLEEQSAKGAWKRQVDQQSGYHTTVDKISQAQKRIDALTKRMQSFAMEHEPQPSQERAVLSHSRAA